jgi:hypothetical protein
MGSFLSEEQEKRFQDDGYLIFERFFDEDEIQAMKADMNALEDARQKGEPTLLLCEYPHLGPLISHPKVMSAVRDVMGPGFGFHHLHATRQGPNTPPANWHQDYEQEPQTNRSHVMVHLFYYFDGLNGEVGDLLVMPGSQRTVIDRGALAFMGTQDLPGMVVVDDLPPGSAVLVHSAVWHARRAKPGGENHPRYFADASYCQAGIRWPSYGVEYGERILKRSMELGLDRNGEYAHLFDPAHFFDQRAARWASGKFEGSIVLRLQERTGGSDA